MPAYNSSDRRPRHRSSRDYDDYRQRDSRDSRRDRYNSPERYSRNDRDSFHSSAKHAANDKAKATVSEDVNMTTEESQPKEKKVPVSLEELLAKKEEEKRAANRVCIYFGNATILISSALNNFVCFHISLLF
jgi:hypothetical protein